MRRTSSQKHCEEFPRGVAGTILSALLRVKINLEIKLSLQMCFDEKARRNREITGTKRQHEKSIFQTDPVFSGNFMHQFKLVHENSQ